MMSSFKSVFLMVSAVLVLAACDSTTVDNISAEQQKEYINEIRESLDASIQANKDPVNREKFDAETRRILEEKSGAKDE